MSGIDKLIKVVANMNTEIVTNRKIINELVEKANHDQLVKKTNEEEINGLLKRVNKLEARLNNTKLNIMNNELKNIEYWKNNAKEDYIKTPISVLRYITELEKRMPLV